MTRSQFDAFCGLLTSVTHVVQWGNSSVWKVGGKIFAICSAWGEDRRDFVSFKCSDLSFSILCEQDGIVPAPYLARAKWVQVQGQNTQNTMSDADVCSYIKDAHALIAAQLTRAKRAELGL